MKQPTSLHFDIADFMNAACKLQSEYGIELVFVRLDPASPYPSMTPWHSPAAEEMCRALADLVRTRLEQRESFRLASQARATQESETLPHFLRVAS